MSQTKENVGSGWWPIVEELEERLTELSPGYTVLQVKEKFGGLRYYAAPADGTSPEDQESFHEAITQAEAKSARFCEQCGAPAKTSVSHGWWVTLCAQHLAEREERRKNRESV